MILWSIDWLIDWMKTIQILQLLHASSFIFSAIAHHVPPGWAAGTPYVWHSPGQGRLVTGGRAGWSLVPADHKLQRGGQRGRPRRLEWTPGQGEEYIRHIGPQPPHRRVLNMENGRKKDSSTNPLTNTDTDTDTDTHRHRHTHTLTHTQERWKQLAACFSRIIVLFYHSIFVLSLLFHLLVLYFLLVFYMRVKFITWKHLKNAARFSTLYHCSTFGFVSFSSWFFFRYTELNTDQPGVFCTFPCLSFFSPESISSIQFNCTVWAYTTAFSQWLPTDRLELLSHTDTEHDDATV